MAQLAVLSPREASIFACLADTVVAPEPVLPPVRETDAVAFFDRWMGARAARRTGSALRALLYALETGPRLLGVRRADAPAHAASGAREYLRAIEQNRLPQLRQLGKLMQGFGQLAYYGDDQVMLRIGYDAEANVARGRAAARAGRAPVSVRPTTGDAYREWGDAARRPSSRAWRTARGSRTSARSSATSA